MLVIVKRSHKKLDPTDKNMVEKKSAIFESRNSSHFHFPSIEISK
jgi:hypothetical protein